MTIEPCGTYKSTWGEGPIWWDGALLYVDIEEHKVVRFNPETGEEQIWDVGERVGTVVPRHSGGLVIAGDNGISFLNTRTGDLTPVADPEPDKPNNRFNDGKVSPDGRFFAGTISLVKTPGDAALYRLDTDKSLHITLDSVTNSNGIVWSADGNTMYYIDTPTKTIARYAYDQVTGKIEGGEVAVNTSHIDTSPDGMAIDAEGKLWVAFCHGGCVKRFDPDNGEELQHIAIPALETTAVAFGGENLDELYITTGIHKTEVEEYAGRIFVVKGLGITGQAANAFKG